MDWTGRVVGPQDLPTYEAPYQRATRSPWYTLQNLQATKQFGMSLSVYGGVKNLWNWTQPSPLIVWEEPFGDRFDTAYIYGPLQTRRFYLGVRWETSGKSHSR
jgi:outer membrane receptor for ferrienterochelin and colicins